MKRVIDIINKIRDTPSINDKVALLQQNNDNDLLKRVLNLTYNPFLQYGVKQLPNVTECYEFSFAYFEDILLKYAEKKGNLTQDMKLYLSRHMGEGKIQELCQKIVNKDLECGINIKLINKSGIINIEEFEPMGTMPTEKLDKFLEKNKEFYSNPKYDGVRCIVEVTNDKKNVVFISRNGKIYDNFTCLIPHIQESIQCSGDITLDGEITHNDFQTLMTITKREDNNNPNIDFQGLSYNVFDITLSNGEDITNMPLFKRVLMLHTYIVENDFVKIVPYSQLHTKEEVDNELEKQISMGYEGLVLKATDSKYKKGKSMEWVKVKKMDTYDATIIGCEEGKGKLKGMLGKFEIQLDNGKTQKCGSGLTEYQRRTLWHIKESLIGKTIEVKYQDITKDGLLRFPIFIRIRDDK